MKYLKLCCTTRSRETVCNRYLWRFIPQQKFPAIQHHAMNWGKKKNPLFDLLTIHLIALHGMLKISNGNVFQQKSNLQYQSEQVISPQPSVFFTLKSSY